MLRIKILYPAHRPDIAYLSDIPLGGCKVCMAQDHPLTASYDIRDTRTVGFSQNYLA